MVKEITVTVVINATTYDYWIGKGYEIPSNFNARITVICEERGTISDMDAKKLFKNANDAVKKSRVELQLDEVSKSLNGQGKSSFSVRPAFDGRPEFKSQSFTGSKIFGEK